MEGISCSGVHRKRTWLGSASRSPFTGEVLEDAAQSEATAEDTAQQFAEITNDVVMGSEDNSG